MIYNYVKDLILRAEGASKDLEQRSWGEHFAYRPFCIFWSIPSSHRSLPTPANCSPEQTTENHLPW